MFRDKTAKFPQELIALRISKAVRIALFGDYDGVKQSMLCMPFDKVCLIVAASIRPQYIEDMRRLALENGKQFLTQPKKNSIHYEAFLNEFQKAKIDLILINSYSMMLYSDLISETTDALNLHWSLLPQNRGANPIQWAMINGEEATGVTLHEVATEVDAGPIIDQIAFAILPNDTWREVAENCVKHTYNLLVKNKDIIINKTWDAKPQDKHQLPKNRRRNPSDSEFHWTEPVKDIYNKIRALVPPMPSAFYYNKQGSKIKFDEIVAVSDLLYMKYDPLIGGNSISVSNYDWLIKIEKNKNLMIVLKHSSDEIDVIVDILEINLKSKIVRIVISDINQQSLRLVEIKDLIKNFIISELQEDFVFKFSGDINDKFN